MTITSIILAHFKEREGNLKRIVDDLLGGTVVPQEVIVFIDNPSITFTDDRVTIIRSTHSFLPIIRFAIGSVCDTDYCFFIDDDLSVKSKTLENMVKYANLYPRAILGLEGSILRSDSPTPYSHDTPIGRGSILVKVDVVIRTYFCSRESIFPGLVLKTMFPYLPKISLDDVYLCLGNKYFKNDSNYVIPVDEETGLTELSDGGVGQSLSDNHYSNRNKVCRFLMDKYETNN